MKQKHTDDDRTCLPAQCFSVKVSGMSVVNDDEVVMLLQEAFKSRLGCSRHAAPVAGLLTCTAEAITLTVLFGKN